MPSRSIGTLTVDLVAKMGGFDEGMGRVDRRMKRTADTIDKEAKRAVKALAAVGLAAVGATAALIKTQANEAQAYLQTARALDIKVESLSAGTYAARQFGIEQDKYLDTLKDVSDKVGDFLATGAGPMADFFENIGPKVGVTAENFRALAADDALQLYVSSLERANVSQNEMTFYLEAIASDASLLVPLFRENGKEMKLFTDQAERLGVVVDQETAESAENLNRVLDQLKSTVSGAGNDLLVSLNPQIKEFTALISDPKTLQGIKTMVGGVADLAGVMVKLSSGTSTLVKSLSEAVARSVGGIAFDDIDAINDRIDEIGEKLEVLGGRQRGRGNAVSKIAQLNTELAGLIELRDTYAIGKDVVVESLADIGEESSNAVKPIQSMNAELKHSFTTLQRIKNIQGDNFGFDWGGRDDPFALPDDLGAGADKVAESVRGIGNEYSQLANISRNVAADMITDFDGTIENMGDSFKKLLAGFAADAAANQIELQFATSTADSSTDAASTASGSWWGAIVVAVAALGQVRNKSEEEKWRSFTAEYRQGVQGTGTLLGNLDVKSQSLNNLIEDLVDKNLDVLNVNYAMLSTLKDIRSGIAGVADGFVRTGLGDAGSAAFAQIALGSRAKNVANFGEWEYLAQNTESAELAGFLSEGNGIKSYLANQFGEEVFGFIGNAVDGIAKNVLRYETDLTDSGIEIFGASLTSIIDGGVLQAQSYADITTTKKFLGIDVTTSVETLTEGLSEITRNQLTGVFASVGAALEIASGQFGIDYGARVGELFIEGGRVSLKDLEGDELSAEIQSLFSSNFDNFASVLLQGTDVLADFQEVGEGAFETMLRLSTETASFASAAAQLNLNFSGAGIDAVYQSQGLVDAAGGTDSLSILLSSYSNAFVDDASRFDFLEQNLTRVFDTLGLEVPRTAEAYVQLVQTQEIVTAAGQEQLAGLLQLADGTREYLDALQLQVNEEQRIRDSAIANWRQYLSEQDRVLQDLSRGTSGALGDLRNAISFEVNELNEGHALRVDAINARFDAQAQSIDARLDSQIENFRRRSDVVSNSISELSSLTSALDSAIGSLRVDSFDLQGRRFDDARLAVAGLSNSVLAGGALPGADLISDLAGDLAGGQEFFASFRDYDLAISHALNDLSQIENVAGAELTDNEKLLEKLELGEANAQLRHDFVVDRNTLEREAALAAEQLQNDAQIELLEQQYEQFEATVNELQGIQENGVNIEIAVNNLRSSIDAEREQRDRVQSEQFEEMREHLENIANNTAVEAERQRENYYGSYEEAS